MNVFDGILGSAITVLVLSLAVFVNGMWGEFQEERRRKISDARRASDDRAKALEDLRVARDSMRRDLDEVRRSVDALWHPGNVRFDPLLSSPLVEVNRRLEILEGASYTKKRGK